MNTASVFIGLGGAGWFARYSYVTLNEPLLGLVFMFMFFVITTFLVEAVEADSQQLRGLFKRGRDN